MPINAIPIAIGGKYNPLNILLEFDVTEDGPFYFEEKNKKSKKLKNDQITNETDSSHNEELKSEDIEDSNFDDKKTHIDNDDTSIGNINTDLLIVDKISLRGAKNLGEGLSKGHGTSKINVPQDLKKIVPQKNVSRGNILNTTRVSHILKMDNYNKIGEKFLEGRLRRVKEEMIENAIRNKKDKNKRKDWVVVTNEPMKSEKTCKVNCSIQ